MVLQGVSKDSGDHRSTLQPRRVFSSFPVRGLTDPTDIKLEPKPMVSGFPLRLGP